MVCSCLLVIKVSKFNSYFDLYSVSKILANLMMVVCGRVCLFLLSNNCRESVSALS